MAKISLLAKAICRFNAIPIKITMIFFIEIEKKILNSYRSKKDPKLLKQSWVRKKQSSGYHVPQFQTILKNYTNQNSMLPA